LVSHKSNLLVENIVFSNSKVPDLNWAWIRYEEWTLTVENCTFKNNENGILWWTTLIWHWRVWINNSTFIDNWKDGTWYTHSIYIWEMSYFEIINSTVSWTSVGHHVKSRARNTRIINNILDDDWKNASYNIDLPNWWEALIKWNKIIQSEQSTNRTMIAYSAEKNIPNPWKLLIEDNEFISYWNRSTWIKNHRNNEVILKNNTFINVVTKYLWNNFIEKDDSVNSINENTDIKKVDDNKAEILERNKKVINIIKTRAKIQKMSKWDLYITIIDKNIIKIWYNVRTIKTILEKINSLEKKYKSKNFHKYDNVLIILEYYQLKLEYNLMFSV